RKRPSSCTPSDAPSPRRRNKPRRNFDSAAWRADPDRSCPPTCRDETSWPARLRHYVRSLGADAVWTTGVPVLGYPPTWATSGAELVAVERVLKTAANDAAKG